MSWDLIPFENLYLENSRNGLTKPSKVRGSGYKMINMGELFANDRIYDISMELVPLNDKEKESANVEKYDLLFARQSLVLEGAGKCSIVMDVSSLTVFESHIIRIRLNQEIANPLFYYYYFRSPYSPIKTIVSQCAQSGIRGSDLQKLKVVFPPKYTQDRISSILSAYDDLIENNQRQIKLLEEAAQRLYKEWFVDLRFPGHEHTAIVDGVPEGWIKCVVTDLLDIKYGKDHKFLNDGNIPVYGSGGIMRKVEPILYSGESVLIPRKGSLNNILYVSGDFWTIDTMFYSVPKRLNIAKYVYLFLSQFDMYSFNTGAAVPSMTVKILESIDTILPSETVINAFNDVVSPLFNRIQLLQEQSEKSKQARDRLLPKLMNGEMEVI